MSVQDARATASEGALRAPAIRDIRRDWEVGGRVDIKAWRGSAGVTAHRWLCSAYPRTFEAGLYVGARLRTLRQRPASLRHPVRHQGEAEPDVLRRRVSEVGGYVLIARRLRRFKRARFASVASASHVGGQAWWDRHVAVGGADLVNAAGIEPLLVVVPHLSIYSLVEADLLRRGHRVLSASYGSTYRARQLRRLGHLAKFPPEAVLRLVKQPNPLYGAYVSRWLAGGGTVVWMPDNLGLLPSEGADGVEVRLLGRSRWLPPVVHRAAHENGARVVFGSVSSTSLGWTVLSDRFELLYESAVNSSSDDVTWHDQIFAQVERSILAQIDSWLLWPFLPNDLGVS